MNIFYEKGREEQRNKKKYIIYKFKQKNLIWYLFVVIIALISYFIVPENIKNLSWFIMAIVILFFVINLNYYQRKMMVQARRNNKEIIIKGKMFDSKNPYEIWVEQ